VKKALNKAEYGLQTAQNNNLKVKKKICHSNLNYVGWSFGKYSEKYDASSEIHVEL